MGFHSTPWQTFFVRKFPSEIGMVRIFATQKRLRRPVSSGSLTAASWSKHFRFVASSQIHFVNSFAAAVHSGGLLWKRSATAPFSSGCILCGSLLAGCGTESHGFNQSDKFIFNLKIPWHCHGILLKVLLNFFKKMLGIGAKPKGLTTVFSFWI